jgi:hypothetical protein
MLNDQNIPPDITAYDPVALDETISNPMLGEVREIISRFSAGGKAKAGIFLSMERQSLIERYAFAIPTAETLCVVARYSPLVEIGAGSGYWAMCLASCGTDIIAYDRYPPGKGDLSHISELNWHFREAWHEVRKGDESSASAHGERTLFLCWPPPENPMAFRALDSYMKAGGRTVIVIGEMNPVAMGDRALYELLKSLTVIERRPFHGWPGFREEILICSCRQGPANPL